MRLAGLEFPTEYVPTVFDMQDVNLRDGDNEAEALVQVIDVATREDYDRLRPLSYGQTDVFVACFSVASPTSYQNVIDKWVPEVRKHCSYAPILLCATKADLRSDKEVAEKLAQSGQTFLSEDDARRLGAELELDAFVATSSLTGDGLAEFQAKVIKLAAQGSERRQQCEKKSASLWSKFKAILKGV